MKKFFAGGNWKMRKTVPETINYIEKFAEKISNITNIDIALFPSFVSLYPAVQTVKKLGAQIFIGAQNMHPEPQGAFTGEVSGEMILSAGAKMVVIGHSERRHIFGETDQFINAKLRHAIELGLTPVFCIGEKLEERKANKTNDVIARQLELGLNNVKLTSPEKLIIAYEPVWAIGTGVNATPEQAEEAQSFIRELIASHWNNDFAKELRIAYGGSVNPENAPKLIVKHNIDGLFVGTASLDVESFTKIVRTVAEASR